MYVSIATAETAMMMFAMMMKQVLIDSRYVMLSILSSCLLFR
jgi:hypothetical protein